MQTPERLRSVAGIRIAVIIGISTFIAASTVNATASARSEIRLTQKQVQNILRVHGVSPRQFKLFLTSSQRVKVRAGKELPNKCGCSLAPQDAGPFGDCFGSCLRTWGVSPIQVVMCGAACGLAESGVGLVVCALCVGLDVTAIEFCAIYCATHRPRDGDKGPGGILGKNSARPDRALERPTTDRPSINPAHFSSGI